MASLETSPANNTTLETYRQCIQALLAEYGQPPKNNNELQTQLIFDTTHDHYQLLEVGWENEERIYNCIMHLDIRDGKIWIQRNMTDVSLAKKLVDEGIPKTDIVLGLHPPKKRPYTEYGVA